MPNYKVDFNKPTLAGNELAYMQQAIENRHISGDGPFTKKCQNLLQEALGAQRVLLTSSCTHALEMMGFLLDIQPGDEIILPDFTFVSTVNAFVIRGARPIFADIRPDTLNIDEKQVERLITPRTRAIVAVHYAGVGCEMDALQALAQPRGIALLEDNAHGLFGQYKGKNLGTLGALATQSFHETKNFSCGEGGALVINDPALIERAEIIREKGTNRSRFFRGQVDKYTWVDVGSSYVISDLLAAYLYAQLEARDKIQGHRQRVWDLYGQALQDWAPQHGVTLPSVPADCAQSYHMFYLLMPNLETRTRLINHLKSRSILSVFHYLPLHLSDMGKKFGGQTGDCPVTEDVSDRLVRLPFYNTLTPSEQEEVIQALFDFEF